MRTNIESLRRFGVPFAAGLAAASLALSACSSPEKADNKPAATASANPEATGSPEQSPDEMFLHQVADSLFAQGEESHGGLRFKSEIQQGNYHTDQDVGAAGVGRGFLAMAHRYPEDPKWKDAAAKTANWLVGVAKKDNKGRNYWPDFVNDDETSDTAYTSPDDGTAGVSDYLWRVGELTGNKEYIDAALSGLDWTIAQAKSGNGGVYWRWANTDSSVQMGMGMGQAGIVTTLATYYERLKVSDPARAAKCKQYAKAGANYIENVRDRLDNNDGDSRALPETGIAGKDGDTNMNAGYLSGTAGSAFMNLKLYQVFGDEKYLTNAKDNLEWLQDTEDGPMVEFGDGSVAWKLAIDNQDDESKSEHDLLPTGFEEGAAGIGWTFLQAYKVTGETQYLDTAKKAAKWLGNIALKSSNGWSWNEGQGHGAAKTKEIVHANLNNGAAGIGMFAEDLAVVTGDKTHKALSDDALKGLRASKDEGAKGIYWKDNGGEIGDDFQNDPSAHWGKAGIVIYLARKTGGNDDAPGLHDALQKR